MTAQALRDLEKRLKQEPDNLGLRVALAGALHEAGRTREAIELYRSVAVSYRDQGRFQQAIAVCRSVLELAPDDEGCQTLLGQLAPPPRRSSMDETPLPGPLPYHVADPTTRSLPKLSSLDIPNPPSERRKPASDDGTFQPPELPKAKLPPPPDDLSGELETRQHVRLTESELNKLLTPSPDGFDDAPTTPPAAPEPHGETHNSIDTEDELTVPRDLPGVKRP